MQQLQVTQQHQQQWQANALQYYNSCCHQYQRQQAPLQSQTPPASAPAAPATPTGAATATPIAAAAARHVAADSEDDSDVADKVLVGGAGTALANETYTYASVCGKVGKYAREAELADASGHSAGVVCFTLHRCNTYHLSAAEGVVYVCRWYISVVPPNLEPGTSQTGRAAVVSQRFLSFRVSFLFRVIRREEVERSLHDRRTRRARPPFARMSTTIRHPRAAAATRRARLAAARRRARASRRRRTRTRAACRPTRRRSC
jgi:hypothetical protein